MAENTRVCRLGLYWESFNISRSWESSAKWPFSTIRSASSITRHLQTRQATSLVSATAGKKNLYRISHSHPSHTLSFTHTHTSTPPLPTSLVHAWFARIGPGWPQYFVVVRKHCPRHPAHITHLRLTSEGKRRERGRLSPELPKVA